MKRVMSQCYSKLYMTWRANQGQPRRREIDWFPFNLHAGPQWISGVARRTLYFFTMSGITIQSGKEPIYPTVKVFRSFGLSSSLPELPYVFSYNGHQSGSAVNSYFDLGKFEDMKTLSQGCEASHCQDEHQFRAKLKVSRLLQQFSSYRCLIVSEQGKKKNGTSTATFRV